MKQLITRWGKNIDEKNILKEYPRPILVRDSYLNLNGKWQCSITKSQEIEKYTSEIFVPFSPESYLSGINQIVQPDDFLHYKKEFELSKDFIKDKVILNFGAVDQQCEVFLNGKKIGENIGGYSSFSFDITKDLKPENNILTLCVVDKTEESPHARGKQKLVKKGNLSSLFYTPNSGIWQTVWLESVNDNYIKNVKITPDLDNNQICIKVITNQKTVTKKAKIKIIDKDKIVKEVEILTNKEIPISLDKFIPWTPENPYLYDVEIIYDKDNVLTYFGMRKYSIDKDKNGIIRFFLNNKPYFHNGVLDQGYWPESLMTPPTDEALKYDIIKIKQLGYNTIRKHVKIESERFYYHCDQIGIIVWQDMPNGGDEYNMFFVTYMPNGLPWFGRSLKDNWYSLFKRKDEEGRKQYYVDLEKMVTKLYNYPSIAVWVPFNEGWGQFDAIKATGLIKGLDNTRLINEACGWFDQKGGDIYSIHNYIRKLKVKSQSDRVVALTEYGGYAYPVKNHMAFEKEFGYKHYSSSENLTDNYKILLEEQIYPNIEKGLSSAIYTQTSDIEEEINGLMTYDREVNKMQEEVIKQLNKKLYKMFDEITNN